MALKATPLFFTGLIKACVFGVIKKEKRIWKRGSGRNLHQSLQKEFGIQDINIGRDKLFDLLRNYQILIK